MGVKARDVVSKYTGIVMGRTEYVFGCSRVLIHAEETRDGKPVDGYWFDEPQVEVIGPSVLASQTAVPPAPRGGPAPDPARRADPAR